jgi:hypothetical protein
MAIVAVLLISSRRQRPASGGQHVTGTEEIRHWAAECDDRAPRSGLVTVEDRRRRFVLSVGNKGVGIFC